MKTASVDKKDNGYQVYSISKVEEVGVVILIDDCNRVEMIRERREEKDNYYISHLDNTSDLDTTLISKLREWWETGSPKTESYWISKLSSDFRNSTMESINLQLTAYGFEGNFKGI